MQNAHVILPVCMQCLEAKTVAQSLLYSSQVSFNLQSRLKLPRVRAWPNANRIHIHSPAVQALHKALRKDRPVPLQGQSQFFLELGRGAKALATLGSRPSACGVLLTSRCLLDRHSSCRLPIT